MAIYKKESLETLRQRVDLVEVLSAHLDLKKSGVAYKGLCPFHDEKTPSFIIQKGDSHYHCFGCGAHGDAIQFLMTHQKMSFSDAVESLAQRFQVQLETIDEKEENKGPNKTFLKAALDAASHFYHFYLLQTPEGHEALAYLYSRGIDLEFIQHFQVGLSPRQTGIFRKMMYKKGIRDEILLDAGLLGLNKDNQTREFFSDRIMFPIYNHTGEVIGFSGRKYKEETFGGKYVNSPETALFKKSKVLFGLHHSRRRIAKDRCAIIVEGQIDALRLIQAGFNFTVAGQGTAFGDGHVKELINLGVNQVYLALDGDAAGQEAVLKIGHLFQKVGIEARVVNLPENNDPDLFLKENGPPAFAELLSSTTDYISFLVKHLAKVYSLESPAGKNELVQIASKMIREWDHPLMVHEALRKLAHLVRVPEEIVGIGQAVVPNIYIKKSASVGTQTIDPDRILETDLLRWMLLLGQEQPWVLELIQKNLTKEDFKVSVCQKIFEVYLSNFQNERPRDFISLMIDLNDAEAQLVLSDLLQKRVNKERADVLLKETIQKILERNWMQKREEIRIVIQAGQCSEDEAMDLMKQFDHLRRQPPQVIDRDQKGPNNG